MNHERYNAITAPYYGRQKKRLLLSALLMVLGYMLAATGIGGIVGVVSMIYLIMEGIRTFSMRKLKKTSLVQMEQKGILTDALTSLDAATLLQVDGLTYALTDGYLFLPHGALLALDDIAWIYQSEQTIRYMMIPMAKIRLCKVALLDGTDTLAFYGNAKDKQAFGASLSSLKDKIPHLLMGYSTENQRIYQSLVAAHKSNPAGWRHAVYTDCVREGTNMTCKDVERDFGAGFSFSFGLPVSGEKLMKAYSSGHRTDTGEAFRNNRITLFESEAYPRVVRITKDIPTFDSGDREYDSWHDLFLAKDPQGRLHGLYATGGYRVAKVINLGLVMDYPDELKSFI